MAAFRERVSGDNKESKVKGNLISLKGYGVGLLTRRRFNGLETADHEARNAVSA
jgi:hypothetical protein